MISILIGKFFEMGKIISSSCILQFLEMQYQNIFKLLIFFIDWQYAS